MVSRLRYWGNSLGWHERQAYSFPNSARVLHRRHSPEQKARRTLYFESCYATLAPLDRAQRYLTWIGAAQMAVVIYAVGGAIDYYEFWWPSLGLLGIFFFLFARYAKRAKDGHQNRTG